MRRICHIFSAAANCNLCGMCVRYRLRWVAWRIDLDPAVLPEHLSTSPFRGGCSRDGFPLIQVRLIESWPDLKAVRKLNESRYWDKFVPVSRLLRPKSATALDSLWHDNVRSMALDPLYEKYLAFYHFRNSILP
jgi:hypothetical protein